MNSIFTACIPSESITHITEGKIGIHKNPYTVEILQEVGRKNVIVGSGNYFEVDHE